MSTYTQILYQVVFGSKGQLPFLNQKNQDTLFRYMGGTLSRMNCHPYKVGGYKNHIHLVFSLHKTVSLSDLVKEIKMSSTAFIKDNTRSYRNFPGWQAGYGAFTYSMNAVDNLIEYVKNQETHHMKSSFKAELIEFLNKNHVEFNEKYLFI